MSSSGLVHAQTEVRKERIKYNWLTKGFDLLSKEVNEKIWSPWFYSRDNNEKWRLEFYPRGMHDNSGEGIEYVGLYLARDSPGKSPITIYAELGISKTNIISKHLSFTQKFKPQQSFGYPKFLERSKLLPKNCSDDNGFMIRCIIDIPVEIVTSSGDAEIFDINKSQLSDDFRLLLEDPIFSDFTIIVGDQKFPAHRYILAKRSPVFAAMFQHENLKENCKKEVKIENIEPAVMRGMLEFIYTDQITNMEELASGLLEVANKYDLEKLRIMCEKTLYEGLNKENAAEVLLLADLHHADTLKKCVIKYIADHALDVVKSNNWTKIRGNPELLLELFNQSVLPQAANTEESQSSK